MAAYPVTEDTMFILYKAPWIVDIFQVAPTTMYCNNKIAVKTKAEWDALAASSGGDASLLASLGITQDDRDGF